MNRLGWVLGTLAAAALSMSQVWLWRRQSQELESLIRLAGALDRTARTAQRPAVNYRLEMNPGVSKEDVRLMLREELQAAGGPEPTATLSGSPQRAEPPSTGSDEQAFQSARALVDEALRSRVWSERQARALGALKSQMAPAKFKQLTADLVPAINSQQVRVDYVGPLFGVHDLDGP